MTIRKQREYLNTQILETQRMLDQVAGHPVMRGSFEQKLKLLKEELEQIPYNVKEPVVTLLFSGGPVVGSTGIDAAFLGKVLLPFQKMVQSDLAQKGYGKVGSRGAIRKSEDAKLFITALPRGSFGVELTKLNENSLFDENQVSDSLSHVSRLIDSSARSDEDFVASLDEVSPRTIQGLKEFLKVIADDKAGITIESGGIRSSLSNEKIQLAYNRVTATNTEVSEINIYGVLKGILLESWKFDFLTHSDETITGSLSSDMSEEDAVGMSLNYFNKNCIASMQKTTVALKSGRIKDSYILNSIQGFGGLFFSNEPTPNIPIEGNPVVGFLNG